MEADLQIMCLQRRRTGLFLLEIREESQCGKICRFHNVLLGHSSWQSVTFYHVHQNENRHASSSTPGTCSRLNALTSNEKCKE